MLNRLFGHKRPKPIPASVLEHTLREVARRLPDLRWAAIVSVDGLAQKMYDPFDKMEPDRAAAMTVAALSLGERISTELLHGQLTYAVVAGDEGLLIIHGIREGYVLAISLPVEAEIGAAIDALTQTITTLTSTLYQDER